MEKSYKIIIGGIDYSKYLDLPFNINLRADEAYNNAQVLLIKTDIPTEFEPYTDVIIKVSNSTNSKTYYMIVEEDNVDEIYRLDKVFYNHSLTLIERTKILDSVYLPSFSVTNPATLTTVENFIGTTGRWEQKNSDYSGIGLTGDEYKDIEGQGQDDVNLNGYTVIRGTAWQSGKQAFIGTGQYWGRIYDGWRSYFDVSEIEHDTTIFNGNYFDVPTPVSLTNPYASAIRVRYDINGVWMGYGWGINDGRTDLECPGGSLLTAYYYYSYSDYGDLGPGYNSRKKIVGYSFSNQKTGKINAVLVKDSSAFRLSGGKVQIKPPNNMITKIGCVVVKPGLWFDNIYKEKYGNTPTYTYLWNRFYTANYSHFKENGGHFKLDTLAKFCAEADGGAEPTSIDEYCSRMATYALNVKYDWNNSSYAGPNNTHWDAEFDINITTVENNSQNIVSAKSPYTTVGEVIDKILNLTDPAYGKFTANNIPDIFRNAEVSERVYESQNMAEILFDLGKIIRAYPELDSTNNISFNELTPIDNPLFSTSTEGTSYAKNTDNAITRYISDVENVISTPNNFTKIYSYWPSRSSFARPNGTEEGASSNPDASTITIPSTDGIYKIEKIEVCNVISTPYTCDNGTVLDSNTIIDITPFCYEKNYFDTLAPKVSESEGITVANLSRDNCIWYEQKKNIIHLEELEMQKKVAFLGTNSAETYRIQNTIVAAIKAKYSESKFKKKHLNENTIDYRYNVCYLEYGSARTITEKFNDSKSREIAANYNQSANIISGNDWGTVAQTDLLRRGSRDLSKSIIIYNVSQIPDVGEGYKSDNGTYFADNINLSFDNNKIVCNMSYTKDYNKILPSVAISKEYRQYEIYGTAAVDRYVNIDRYWYMDINPEDYDTNSGDYMTTMRFTDQLVFNGRKKVPSIAVVVFKDANKNPIKYNSVDAEGNLLSRTTKPIVIPITYTNSGNNISFTAKLKDNFSGGVHPNSSLNVPYKTILGTDKDSGAWVLEHARYVDDYGEAKYASFYLIKPDYEYTVFKYETYPYVDISESVLRGNSLDYEEDILIDKDNRERICFNYQIHFLTQDNRIKWHPAMLKYLFYDQSTQNSMLELNNSYYTAFTPRYYGYNYKLQDERFAPSTNIKSSGVSRYPQMNEDGKYLYKYDYIDSRSLNAPNYKNIKSIALVWPKTNEILFHIDIDDMSTSLVPKIVFRPYKQKK